MKMIFYTFSKDFKIEELLADVYLVKEEWIFEQPGYSFINISKKDVSWAKSVTPKKLITCKYTRMLSDEGRFKKSTAF